MNNYVKKYNNEIRRIVEEYRNKNKNIRIEDLNKEIKDIDNLFFIEFIRIIKDIKYW